MNRFMELIEAARVAHAMKEGVEQLLQNAITTNHTMDACMAIVRAENEEERDRLSEALLVDVVNRMSVELDSAIKHLSDNPTKGE